MNLGFRSLLLLVGAVAASGSGCSCPSSTPPPAPHSVPEAREPADEKVRPVYPPLTGAPDPRVQKLCDALNAAPETARGACCRIPPGVAFTTECYRALNGAVAAGAVSLDGPAVDGCAAAMARALSGCDWVGPNPLPMPRECLGVARGQLSVSAPCRSSLECQTGFHCRGAGPTQAGVCTSAGADGSTCYQGVDSLATYLRQDAYEEDHPECSGYCDRHRCKAHVAVGGACAFNGECGHGRRCGDGHCLEGNAAALGAACLGAGCAEGTRCLDGHCARPKPAGAACTKDAECVGGCVIADGGARVCGLECSRR